MIRLLVALACTLGSAAAQTLEIDQSIVTRRDSLKATVRLASPLQGPGTLNLRWTDSYGRTVAAESRTVQIRGASVPVTIPLQRAVAMENFLEAELVTRISTIKVPRTQFIVTPDEPWDDYQVIMYYPYTPAQQPALRALGVTAGQIQNVGSRTPEGAAIWWRNGFRFYCDQMAYDFFAPYHTPALKDKELRMREAKALYKQDRTKKDAFFRQPCFDDHAAEEAAMARIRHVAAAQRRFRPFFYSTDETGVANLVEAWDFCFCPLTLSAMRKWLLERYGSLEAINREWETSYASVNEVTPLSTDEMMRKGGTNFSQWADHRTFMNVSFASAGKKASATVKSVDPQGIAGFVGCQMPAAFGGYDYWLLSQALDVAEPYNIGSNREIWRSFVPRKPAITTGFGAGDHEVWRLWYQALHGDSGVIIYDEENRYLDAAGNPTSLGNLVAPTYRELTGGIGKQLHYMERVNDPVAVHYSQPSITAHWMFERSPLGTDWVEKRSFNERRESDFLRLRQSVVHLLEDNLRQYYFVSYAQMETGAFDTMGAKILILPQSVAMSAAECAAARRFVERGGTLVADCRTALMDEHCKALPAGQLDDLFGISRADAVFAPGPAPLKASDPAVKPSELNAGIAEPGIRVLPGARALYGDARSIPAVIVKNHGKGRTVYLNAVITNYHRNRLRPPEGDSLREFVAALLSDAGIPRQYSITRPDGTQTAGVEIHPWASGEMRILGIHRNYGLNISELGPTEYQKQDALEGPLELRVDFGKTVALYDQRKGRFLGNRKEYVFPLDKIQPTILTILPAGAAPLSIAAPDIARPGDLVEVRLGAEAGSTRVYRVRVLDPAGAEVAVHTANLAAPRGRVRWELPIAASMKPGRYTLQARDLATGTAAQHVLTVK
jgi:hypothetical protein